MYSSAWSKHRPPTRLPYLSKPVTRTEQGDSVRGCFPEGQVSTRPVKVSIASGNRWVIQEGLKDGEQVMVDGFQKLQMFHRARPSKQCHGRLQALLLRQRNLQHLHRRRPNPALKPSE